MENRTSKIGKFLDYVSDKKEYELFLLTINLVQQTNYLNANRKQLRWSREKFREEGKHLTNMLNIIHAELKKRNIVSSKITNDHEFGDWLKFWTNWRNCLLPDDVVEFDKLVEEDRDVTKYLPGKSWNQ